MIRPFDLLIDIQTAVIAHLKNQPIFAQIPIIGQDVGDDVDQVISDRIDAQVSKVSAGIVGVVVPVVADSANPDIADLYYDKISLFVQWTESIIINRAPTGSRLFACTAAVATNYYLNGNKPKGLSNFYVDQVPWVQIPQDDPAFISYKCNHFTHGGAKLS